MVLNKQHKVISNLDIFAKVGKAAAHDEVTKFKIEDGQFITLDDTRSNFGGTLSVEFSKVNGYPLCQVPGVNYTSSTQGMQDNPKVNAIVLLRGPIKDSGMELLPQSESNSEFGISPMRFLVLLSMCNSTAHVQFYCTYVQV